MNNRLLKKLKSLSGETLAETLVAVLILSIVSVALAAMIGSATRMNISARENDERLDKAMENMMTAETAEGTATVTVGSGKVTFPIKMQPSGDDSLKLCSYDVRQPASASQPDVID